ncbi:MAG: GDSL-type esterase/lipase family protein [Bacteroidales bacterium]|nr:GDSL-type esterase/lipase family protein [Bacteroidales bacterium]
MACLMMSCDSDEDARLVFVGDSIAAGWDVTGSFPTRQVINLGNPGSGVEYLENLQGTLRGCDAVVISGTNDSRLFLNDAQGYAERYLNAIIGLEAKRVYLYCVFPRATPYNGADVNSKIKDFNALVKRLVDGIENVTYIDVYDDLLMGENLSPNYTYDGLHLTWLGYQVLRGALLNIID